MRISIYIYSSGIQVVEKAQYDGEYELGNWLAAKSVVSVERVGAEDRSSVAWDNSDCLNKL